MENYEISLTVNGKSIQKRIPSHLMLVDFLRHTLDLTGTKEVCGEGECGACTIILNEKIVDSCLVFAVEADGAKITTIEGISDRKTLTKLQQAFIDYHSVQCGYCIPGMILSGEHLLKEDPHPSRDAIKSVLAGNICRCTGYHKILDAIRFAHREDDA
ncbi:MAG: (2Fe-2S)-binding protein [Fidelibacterota bacterium]